MTQFIVFRNGRRLAYIIRPDYGTVETIREHLMVCGWFPDISVAQEFSSDWVSYF